MDRDSVSQAQHAAQLQRKVPKRRFHRLVRARTASHARCDIDSGQLISWAERHKETGSDIDDVEPPSFAGRRRRTIGRLTDGRIDTPGVAVRKDAPMTSPMTWSFLP